MQSSEEHWYAREVGGRPSGESSGAVSSKVLPLLGLLLGMVPASLLASKLVNWKTRDLSYPFLRAEK